MGNRKPDPALLAPYRDQLVDLLDLGFLALVYWLIWNSYWNFETYWYSLPTYPRLDLPPLGWTFFVGFVGVAFAAVRAKDSPNRWSKVCFGILSVIIVVAGMIMYPRYLWTPPWTWIDYVMIPLFAFICAIIAVTGILTLLAAYRSGRKVHVAA